MISSEMNWIQYFEFCVFLLGNDKKRYIPIDRQQILQGTMDTNASVRNYYFMPVELYVLFRFKRLAQLEL